MCRCVASSVPSVAPGTRRTCVGAGAHPCACVGRQLPICSVVFLVLSSSVWFPASPTRVLCFPIYSFPTARTSVLIPPSRASCLAETRMPRQTHTETNKRNEKRTTVLLPSTPFEGTRLFDCGFAKRARVGDTWAQLLLAFHVPHFPYVPLPPGCLPVSPALEPGRISLRPSVALPGRVCLPASVEHGCVRQPCACVCASACAWCRPRPRLRGHHFLPLLRVCGGVFSSLRLLSRTYSRLLRLQSTWLTAVRRFVAHTHTHPHAHFPRGTSPTAHSRCALPPCSFPRLSPATPSFPVSM